MEGPLSGPRSEFGRLSLRSRQPICFKPMPLSSQGIGAPAKRAQLGAADWRQIGPPAAIRVRLDMTGTTDRERPQATHVDRFSVDAAHLATWLDDNRHELPPSKG